GRGTDRALPIIVMGATDASWARNAFETDSDLPAGWVRVQDASGTYYWHIPTGTTQWEPPADLGQGEGGDPGAGAAGLGPAHPPPGIAEPQVSRAGLGFSGGAGSGPMVCPLPQSFPGQSLGWVEMSEEELAPGKSSAAVNSCIRQLAAPPPPCPPLTPLSPQGRAMLLLLDRETLRLVEPIERTLLHAQPVASIRVWGVGRDDGRDFAYVARDPLTQMLKCHVFRCETPAKGIATSLQAVCSQVRSPPGPPEPPLNLPTIATSLQAVCSQVRPPRALPNLPTIATSLQAISFPGRDPPEPPPHCHQPAGRLLPGETPRALPNLL
uniref:Amyloid beta protein binding family B member 1 n=1 Tax=Chrysemys picta bellii TaxID=8478 RepID=A0A8C3H8N1_CHRPI